MKSILWASIVVIALFFLSGCSTQYTVMHDSDPNDRRQAVKELQDEAILAEVALSDKDRSVRYAAVEKLHDEKVLARIVLKETDWSITLKAILKISDETLLASIAMSHSDANLTDLATGRIKNQELLYRIAGGNGRAKARASAVERLSDQKQIASVLLGEKSSLVISSGMKRLNDPEALARIALEHPKAKVRLQALKGITDQATLENILSQETDAECRLLAVRKLRNQKLLSQVAMTDEEAKVRREAFTRLSDALMLSDFQIHKADTQYQGWEYGRMSSPALYILAVQSVCQDVKEHAMDTLVDVCFRIEDQDEVDRYAMQTDFPTLRKRALEKTNNQKLLCNIAGNHLEDKQVRLRAFMRCLDGATLTEVADNTGESLFLFPESARYRIQKAKKLRQHIIEKTGMEWRALQNNPEVLDDAILRTATGGPEPEMRETAVEYLTNTPALFQTLKKDPDRSVRRSAVRRLSHMRGQNELSISLLQMIYDPVVCRYLGDLKVKQTIRTTRKKYGSSSYAWDRSEIGYLDIESLTVVITDEKGDVISIRTFKGDPGASKEVFKRSIFGNTLENKINKAEPDYGLIAMDIVSKINPKRYQELVSSHDYHLKKAALELMKKRH